MNKSEKTEMISQIVNQLKESTAVFLVDYKGVNVEDVNELRSKFTEADITFLTEPSTKSAVTMSSRTC